MFTTIIITSSATSLVTALVIFQLLQSPEKCDNSTIVLPTMDPLSFVNPNKSLAYIFHENMTLWFDLKTANHSFTDLEEQLYQKYDLLFKSKIREYFFKYEGELEKLRSNMTSLTTEVGVNNFTVQNLQITLLNVNTTTELLKIDMKTKLIQHDDALEKLTKQLTKQQSNNDALEKLIKQQYNNIETIEKKFQSLSNISSEGILMAVICVLTLEMTIFLIKWCMSTNKTYLTSSDELHQPAVNNKYTFGSLNRNEVHVTEKKLERGNEVHVTGKKLERGVSVLGFYGGALNKCHTLLSDIVTGQPLHKTLVKSLDGLRRIGGHTMMIFVIPFNEMNVILDEPGLLQGQKNIRIVKYLLSRGVDLFVIYIGDQNSSQLKPDRLYHPHLRSVETNSTLRQLSNRGRFMSIDTNFTPHQKNCIKEAMINVDPDHDFCLSPINF